MGALRRLRRSVVAAVECPECGSQLDDVRWVGPEDGRGGILPLVLVGDCRRCRDLRQVEP